LLGLYQGLKHLSLAGAILYAGIDTLPDNALVCLILVSAFAATIAAGTVNRRAEVMGLIIGLSAAGSFVGPDLAAGVIPHEEWLIGVPTLLMLVGVGGGTIGRLLMPPAPRLPKFGNLDSTLVTAVKSPRPRLCWWRVILGAIPVVAGTMYADDLRNVLLTALAGSGGSFGSARLVAWQITVLTSLFGGLLAGANTRGGFRQGFVTGGLGGLGSAVAVSSMGAEKSLVVEFWLEQLSMKEPSPVVFAAMAGAVWAATTVGGWLGGQILPPPRRK
jgi:MFS family permease